MDLSQMTIEQLVAENQRLGREIDALRERRRAINAEIARREEARIERQVREEVARRLGRPVGGDATAPGVTLVAAAPKAG